MRIMYVLQQSIYHQEENGMSAWTSADSNLNMAIGILSQILEQTNWEIVVIHGQPFSDITSPDKLLHHTRLIWHGIDFPIDSNLLRYSFDMLEWKYLFEYYCPDVIWNNISEISRNFKALIKIYDKPIKLINCNYWMSTPYVDTGDDKKFDTEIDPVFRQIDGAYSADLVPFTCSSTKQAFELNVRQFALPFSEIDKKSRIWDFGFSQAEMNVGIAHPVKFEKPTIVFPNRLSGINYTHHLEFIEAMQLLDQWGCDFQVVVTNPSQKVSWDWLQEHIPHLHILRKAPLTREEYASLLAGADIIMSLFTLERYGGCANVEGIYCGCLPVMPKVYEYAKRAPSDYPGFLSHVEVTAQEIARVIQYLLIHIDKIKSQYISRMRDHVSSCSSYEMISHTVIEDIRKCVKP